MSWIILSKMMVVFLSLECNLERIENIAFWLIGVCIAVGKFWSLSDFLIRTVPLTVFEY